jgi:hypothetical protein
MPESDQENGSNELIFLVYTVAYNQTTIDVLMRVLKNE